MKTILLGLGNPILRDDGVGWQVVQAIEEHFGKNLPPEIEIDCFPLGGISLMERLIGYDRAILVDAIQTKQSPPGTISRLTLDDLPSIHANAIHDAALKDALEFGRKLGAELPQEIVIYAIEAVDLWEFDEKLSPQLETSVMPAARAVLAEIDNWRNS